MHDRHYDFRNHSFYSQSPANFDTCGSPMPTKTEELTAVSYTSLISRSTSGASTNVTLILESCAGFLPMKVQSLDSLADSPCAGPTLPFATHIRAQLQDLRRYHPRGLPEAAIFLIRLDRRSISQWRSSCYLNSRAGCFQHIGN